MLGLTPYRVAMLFQVLPWLRALRILVPLLSVTFQSRTSGNISKTASHTMAQVVVIGCKCCGDCQWGRIDRASGYKEYSMIDTYTRQGL